MIEVETITLPPLLFLPEISPPPACDWAVFPEITEWLITTLPVVVRPR